MKTVRCNKLKQICCHIFLDYNIFVLCPSCSDLLKNHPWVYDLIHKELLVNKDCLTYVYIKDAYNVPVLNYHTMKTCEEVEVWLHIRVYLTLTLGWG
jgi:hypothetical protein